LAKTLESETPVGGEKKPRGGKIITGEARIDRELMADVFKNLHAKADAGESYAGTIATDMKKIYEDAANDYGVPVKVIKTVYQEERHQRKLAKKLHKLEPSERDALTALAKAFEGTPMGERASKMADEAVKQALH